MNLIGRSMSRTAGAPTFTGRTKMSLPALLRFIGSIQSDLS
jgi:hypothetical protein